MSRGYLGCNIECHYVGFDSFSLQTTKILEIIGLKIFAGHKFWNVVIVETPESKNSTNNEVPSAQRA